MLDNASACHEPCGESESHGKGVAFERKDGRWQEQLVVAFWRSGWLSPPLTYKQSKTVEAVVCRCEARAGFSETCKGHGIDM